jgi:hypothetical protein
LPSAGSGALTPTPPPPETLESNSASRADAASSESSLKTRNEPVPPSLRTESKYVKAAEFQPPSKDVEAESATSVDSESSLPTSEARVPTPPLSAGVPPMVAQPVTSAPSIPLIGKALLLSLQNQLFPIIAKPTLVAADVTETEKLYSQILNLKQDPSILVDWNSFVINICNQAKGTQLGLKSIEQCKLHHALAKATLNLCVTLVDSSVATTSPSPLAQLTPPNDFEIQHRVFDPSLVNYEHADSLGTNITWDMQIKDTMFFYTMGRRFDGSVVHNSLDSRYTKTLLSSKETRAVECAANLGLNGLAHVLDDKTREAVSSGFFIPNAEIVADVILQLKQQGHLTQYPVILIPSQHTVNSVGIILVATPMFGDFGPENDALTKEDREQIQFICAFNAFTAQFEMCLRAAKEHKKQIVLKLAALGMGRLGHEPSVVAKALYAALTLHQKALNENRVQVRVQVLLTNGAADVNDRQIVDLLDLPRYKAPS